MGYFYPLLLYAVLGGGLLLLGIASLTWLHSLHKPVTATSLLIVTLLWILLPTQGRLAFSLWSPGKVLGGQILLDVHPAIWWLGLTASVVLCGAAWTEAVERRKTLPLVGPLLLAALIVLWGTLTAGSLLTTLATWALFDLIWAAASLVSGANGERITFGLVLHGIATIILWMVALLLLREGESELWWLMWPSSPMLTLLLLAALLRIGFFPFQIVFPRKLGTMRSLNLVYLMGPVTGLGLLYRLMLLPGIDHLPVWVILWGVFSVFWNGLMAWSTRNQHLPMRVVHALLIGIVAGAVALDAAELLMMVPSVWLAASALLVLAREYDVTALTWSWLAWGALLFMLGAPPSPLGALFAGLFGAVSWGWRVLLCVGFALGGATLMRDCPCRARATVAPPWAWQRVGLGFGLLIIAVSGVGLSVVMQPVPFSWVGFVLWFVGILGAFALARWGRLVRRWSQRLSPIFEFLDLQWFYRSMWRGAGHLLSVLRVSAEVVEGSGAVMWSLLILLLTLLVMSSR